MTDITGWQEGRTQLRAWWRGTDNPGPDAAWTEYLTVLTGEVQAMTVMASIARHVKALELISADLEPLGRVIACPACDHVLLEVRRGGPWCPRCGRTVPRAELERAAGVKSVTEAAMDVIGQAVTDGRLPG
jgi:hypothetical protein